MLLGGGSPLSGFMNLKPSGQHNAAWRAAVAAAHALLQQRKRATAKFGRLDPDGSEPRTDVAHLLVNVVGGQRDVTRHHDTLVGEHGASRVLMAPAAAGTGIIAGGGVRAVCEAVGIRDVLAKSMGSSNHANVVKATLKALSQLRSRDQVLSGRGKKKKEKAIYIVGSGRINAMSPCEMLDGMRDLVHGLSASPQARPDPDGDNAPVAPPLRDARPVALAQLEPLRYASSDADKDRTAAST